MLIPGFGAGSRMEGSLEHSGHVGIDRRLGSFEGEARDRPGGVATDSRQGPQFLNVSRNRPVPFGYYCLGQPVQVDRGDVALSRLTVLSPQLFCDPSTELIKSPTLGITAPGASVERQFQIPENICRDAISSAASVDSVTVQRQLPTPDQQVVARTVAPGIK